MPRNVLAVQELQNAAIALLSERGPMEYADFLAALDAADLSEAKPFIQGLRAQGSLSFSLSFEDGKLTHTVSVAE